MLTNFILNADVESMGNQTMFTDVSHSILKQDKFDEFISPDEGLFERNM